MRAQRYLKRIGLNKIGKPDHEFLRILHKNHLLNIPFENLDIHRNKEIVLSYDLLFTKIIEGKRGGYCYELNGMFFHLLKELGYKVKMISARVRNGKGGWGAEFDHLAIVSEVEGKEYLTDVGFGDNFFEPVEIVTGKIRKDRKDFFKIENYDSEYLVLMRSSDGMDFKGEYIFTLRERSWEEFQGMNKFHQTSPDSHFTRNRVCSIATSDGRISLTDLKLTVTTGKEKVITEVTDENDFRTKLFENFGIDWAGRD